MFNTSGSGVANKDEGTAEPEASFAQSGNKVMMNWSAGLSERPITYRSAALAAGANCRSVASNGRWAVLPAGGRLGLPRAEINLLIVADTALTYTCTCFSVKSNPLLRRELCLQNITICHHRHHHRRRDHGRGTTEGFLWTLSPGINNGKHICQLRSTINRSCFREHQSTSTVSDRLR